MQALNEFLYHCHSLQLDSSNKTASSFNEKEIKHYEEELICYTHTNASYYPGRETLKHHINKYITANQIYRHWGWGGGG